VITSASLSKPAAVPPSLAECTQLIDAFLAGRNPRTLAAYQADLEDFRRFMEASFSCAPTIGGAVERLIVYGYGTAKTITILYFAHLVRRRLQSATVNHRLATLRSLIKRANTLGLVPWTLSIENLPVWSLPRYTRAGP
jgi:hypothetical protein